MAKGKNEANLGQADLYQYLMQRKAASGVGFTPQEEYGIVAGVQAAQEQSMLAHRDFLLREKAARQQKQAAQRTALVQGVTGTAQLALQLPATVQAMEKMGWFGGKAIAPAATTGTTSTGLVPTTAVAGSELGGDVASSTAFAPSAGAGAGAGEAGAATAAPSYGTYGASFGAGAVAGAYGPYRRQTGSVMLLGKGGKRTQTVAGGAAAGAGAGAGVGFMVGGPYGAAVGTVMGALGGGISAYMKSGKKKGTVICTELHAQGLVSQELLDFEARYQYWTWDTYWGYRFWADPVVSLMQRSKLFSRFMALLAVPFLKEIAHRVEPEQPKNYFGSLILKLGVPLCKWNYARVMRKQPRLLDKFVRVGN